MDSPLSPILAEIYTNDFENHIMKNRKYKNNIKLWTRYVDKPIPRKGTDNQLNQFVTEINNINKDTQSTREKCDRTINYLNLTIIIKNKQQHMTFMENQRRRAL